MRKQKTTEQKQRAPKFQLAGELTHEQRCSLGQAPAPKLLHPPQPLDHEQPAGIGADQESIGA